MEEVAAAINDVVLRLVRRWRRAERSEGTPAGKRRRRDWPVGSILGGAHRRAAASAAHDLRSTDCRRLRRLGLAAVSSDSGLVAVGIPRTDGLSVGWRRGRRRGLLTPGR